MASGPIHSIVFACDAGMGSSAMGASVLRKKVQGAGYSDVTVVNKAIANLDDTYDLVVTHQDLTARARERTPRRCTCRWTTSWPARSTTRSSSCSQQANGPETGDVVAEPAAAERRGLGALLPESAIVLDGNAGTRDEAITRGRCAAGRERGRRAGVRRGHARAREVGVDVHGQLAGHPARHERRQGVDPTGGLSFVRYPQGVDWNGKTAKFVVGVAGAGDEHLALLGKIAQVFLDADKVAALEAATSTRDVAAVLDGVTV